MSRECDIFPCRPNMANVATHVANVLVLYFGNTVELG